MKLTRSEIRKIILQEIKCILEDTLSSTTADVRIDKNLDRCLRHEDLIREFCEFCASFLNITEPIVIQIINDRDLEGVRTTADYNPEDHRIRVYGKNRAIVDICRSIAHEMTHMGQMISGRLKFPVQDAGGEIEDEANAKAGEIIKIFAKSQPDRKAIYENKDVTR